jgi:hypothetical protein
MVQLSVPLGAVLVSLMSFATITLCVASQQVLIVVVYFVINSVQKLLDIPSYSGVSFFLIIVFIH